MARVFIFESHPIQYRGPVYQELHQLMPDGFEIIYGTDATLKPDNPEPDFGRKLAWDTELLEGYRFRVLGNETSLPLTQPKSLSGRGVFSLLRRERPSAIVLTSLRFHMDFTAYASALLLRIPILIRQETQDEMFAGRRGPLKEGIRFLVYRILYAPVRHAFAFGRLNHAHLRRHGIAPERLSFARFSVPNPLDGLPDSSRVAMRLQTRQRFDIGADQFVIGFAGKFIEKKHPDLVFQAVEHLPAELKSRLHLLFVGDGPMAKELADKALIADHRWGIRTTFTGFVNQSRLTPHYLAMDVLVLPSRRMGEAWGLVVNEALNAGCAVAMTDAVGCSAEFGDLQRVRVTPTESDRDLAKAITELASFRRDFRWAEARMQAYSSRAAAEGMRDGLAPYLDAEPRAGNQTNVPALDA